MSQSINESNDTSRETNTSLYIDMSNEGSIFDIGQGPSRVIETMQIGVDVEQSAVVTTETGSPPPRLRRKRKRRDFKWSKSPSLLDEADDNGSTCSICFDNWDLSGPHRLTSLKCGHLFGNSCIKRWIEDSSPRHRLCPQCKKRATPRDFRYIYAKKVTAMDNSEEIRLREQLKSEREKYLKLEMEYSLLNINLKFEREKCVDLQERLCNLLLLKK